MYGMLECIKCIIIMYRIYRLYGMYFRALAGRRRSPVREGHITTWKLHHLPLRVKTANQVCDKPQLNNVNMVAITLTYFQLR